VLALLALALPVAACGESETDKYVDDFKPLNDRLLKIGRELGDALEAADSQSDAALEKRFSALAKQLEDVNGEIAALDTPADLQDEAKGLNKALDAATLDVEDIAKAAGAKDAEDAAAATLQLSSNAQKVNSAQNKLARATGAEVGQR
jgi:hypothetical protein